MPSPFSTSLFSQLMHSNKEKSSDSGAETVLMAGVTGSRFAPETKVRELPMVVFDFETTGLNYKLDRIIEIGAIKYQGKKEVGRVTTLIDPKRHISSRITEVTGIKPADLLGQPLIHSILPQLHELMTGALLVAHNAEFDMSFLNNESGRCGMSCNYTSLCTLKMSRALNTDLPKHNLDMLAEHYHLSFESRHRSIGDIKVTAQVLWKILDDHPEIQTIQDIAPYLALPQ